MTWAKLTRLRRQRRVQNGFTFGLVFLGPMLAVATFLGLGPFSLNASSQYLRLILLTDLIYVLLVAALVGAWLVLRSRTATPPAAVPACHACWRNTGLR